LDHNPKTALSLASAMQDGLPTPRRYFSILAIWMAMTLAVLDGTIANVALPTIAHELNVSPGLSIWVINSYQLVITIALLPLAGLGDTLGYRRVFLAGIALFTVGSLGCALSQDLTQLIAARIVQGLGAAGLMAINTAMVRLTFPARMLGRGIGLNAVVVAAGSVVGPTLASAILAVAPWPWLFAVNVPIGIATVLLGMRALPASAGSRAPLDLIAVALNAVALAGVILGLESLVREGLVAGLWKILLGLAAGVLLVRRELPLKAPMLPLDLMRIPLFRLSIMTSIVTFSAQTLAFVALPFFFQSELGKSAVETGFLMTPWPLALVVTAPIAGRLADHVPAGLLGGGGLLVFALGMGLLAGLTAESGTVDIAWRMAVCGVGFGFFQSPNNRTLVASSPPERSGAAGGMLSIARLLGQTLGTVAMAVLFHLSLAAPTTAALVFASGLAAAGAVISLLRLRVSGPA
jgi:DHA2 family multidrug resistance protein-like MFS transporter